MGRILMRLGYPRLPLKPRCHRSTLQLRVRSVARRRALRLFSPDQLSLRPLSLLRHPRRCRELSQSSPTNSPPSRSCQTMSYGETALRRSAAYCLRNPASPDRALRPVHPADRSFAGSTSIGCASKRTASEPMVPPTSAKTTLCQSTPLRATKSRSFAGQPHCGSARKQSAA